VVVEGMQLEAVVVEDRQLELDRQLGLVVVE